MLPVLTNISRHLDQELMPDLMDTWSPFLRTAGEGIREGDPLCPIGDSGTGRSHLLICPVTATAMAGYRVDIRLSHPFTGAIIERIRGARGVR
ncbi:hypothetical protein GFH48_00960 [Streptomyces fagopyri]|uniref:Uncharacterized protein n=1 Tax=Streptomyces fagopyri TaxID=2662397 RepID=A0A5Q0L4W7_9ACTN|nr:hypothetical protein [Streptomyces fagopyri]QFZ72032.1 hypothetical protein GFH48_00960 [Streptomyces fagopyri]